MYRIYYKTIDDSHVILSLLLSRENKAGPEPTSTCLFSTSGQLWYYQPEPPLRSPLVFSLCGLLAKREKNLSVTIDFKTVRYA